MYFMRGLEGAHLIAGRHRRHVEVENQQAPVAIPDVAGDGRRESAVCVTGATCGRRRRGGRGSRRRLPAASAAAPARSASRWNSTNAMSCGSPSSVMTKSLAVSPSIGLPSLSLTRHGLHDQPRARCGRSAVCGGCRLLLRARSGDERRPPGAPAATTNDGACCARMSSEPHPQAASESCASWLARFGRPNCGLPTMVLTLA